MRRKVENGRGPQLIYHLLGRFESLGRHDRGPDQSRDQLGALLGGCSGLFGRGGVHDPRTYSLTNYRLHNTLYPLLKPPAAEQLVTLYAGLLLSSLRYNRPNLGRQ